MQDDGPCHRGRLQCGSALQEDRSSRNISKTIQFGNVRFVLATLRSEKIAAEGATADVALWHIPAIHRQTRLDPSDRFVLGHS